MRQSYKNIGRNFFSVFASFAIAAVVLPVTSVQAATSCAAGKVDFTKGNLCYDITSGSTVTCLGLSKSAGNSTTVTVPATVTCNGKAYKVNKVAGGAFAKASCLKQVRLAGKNTCLTASCFSKAGCVKVSTCSTVKSCQ